MRQDDEPKETETDAQRPGRLLEDRLFKSRSVLITGTIQDKLAARVSAQLLALAADVGEAPITCSSTRPAATSRAAT